MMPDKQVGSRKSQYYIAFMIQKKPGPVKLTSPGFLIKSSDDIICLRDLYFQTVRGRATARRSASMNRQIGSYPKGAASV